MKLHPSLIMAFALYRNTIKIIHTLWKSTVKSSRSGMFLPIQVATYLEVKVTGEDYLALRQFFACRVAPPILHVLRLITSD